MPLRQRQKAQEVLPADGLTITGWLSEGAAPAQVSPAPAA